jgi:hypothetical protein
MIEKKTRKIPRGVGGNAKRKQKVVRVVENNDNNAN